MTYYDIACHSCHSSATHGIRVVLWTAVGMGGGHEPSRSPRWHGRCGWECRTSLLAPDLQLSSWEELLMGGVVGKTYLKSLLAMQATREVVQKSAVMVEACSEWCATGW